MDFYVVLRCLATVTFTFTVTIIVTVTLLLLLSYWLLLLTNYYCYRNTVTVDSVYNQCIYWSRRLGTR